MKFLRYKVPFAVSLSLIIFAMSAGVLFAQLWGEPPTAPPALEGDDPTPGLNVLFSGQTLNTDVGCATGPGAVLCGGGEAQRRSGALTLGSATPAVTDDELTVIGEEVISDQLIVGVEDFSPTFGVGHMLIGEGQAANGIAIASSYEYIVGSDDGNNWRIEKRLTQNHELDVGFGANGVVLEPLGLQAQDIAVNSNYIFVVGETDSLDWRIEKRSLVDGTLDAGFDDDGVVIGSSVTETPNSVAIDSTYMYVFGSDTSGWRIEKRLLSNGKLCSAANCGTEFGTGGIITGQGGGGAKEIAISSTYMYLVGYDVIAGPDFNWRIEKRLLSNGQRCTAANCGTEFGTEGVISGSADWAQARGVAIDSTYMYIAGYRDISGWLDWQIEKRLLSNGQRCTEANCGTEFGTGGIVISSSSSITNTDIAIDGAYMYVVGNEEPVYNWRIEKISLTTGAPDVDFGINGVVSGDAHTVTANAIAIDGNNMYVVGSVESSDWYLEKRELSDGEPTGGTASIGAFATSGYGIYGETLAAAYSGIHGTTTATSDGKGVWGYTGEAGGIAVYATSAQSNKAIHGENATSWAGYFDGKVQIVNGTFYAVDADFMGDVAVLGAAPNVTVDDDVTIGGINIKEINALSLQDQLAASPPTPPGVQFLTLDASEIEDGVAHAWTDVETGLVDTDQLVSLTALYRDVNDPESKWKIYDPLFTYQLSYKQCTGTFWNQITLPGASSTYDIVQDDATGAMYVGTSWNGDVFKSVDSGVNWFNTANLTNSGTDAVDVWMVIVANDGSVYAATGNESDIYKSTDGGASWVRYDVGGIGSADLISVFQDSSGYLYTGQSPNGQIFRSIDNGDSWVQIYDFADSVYIHHFVEDSSGALYIATTTDVTDGDVYKSTAAEGGFTWTNTEALGPSGDLVGASRINKLHVDNDGTLYALSEPNADIYSSNDGGVSWTNLGGPPGMTSVNTMFTGSNGFLYLSADSGGGLATIFQSDDSGVTWTPLVGGFSGEAHTVIETREGFLMFNVGANVYRSTSPVYLPEAAGSIALKNTTGVEADFRIMVTYIPGVNACP